MKKTNEMTVTGRILSLEERKSVSGPFYLVNLETFYGPNIKTQVWGKDYEFIKKNELRAANEAGIGGDYIDVTGYTHTYILETKNGDQQFVTFKTNNVKRPMARVTYSGRLHHLNYDKIEVLSDQIGFLFDPDTPCFYKGEWLPANSIHCIIDKTNPDYEQLKNENYFIGKKVNAIISGSVDNTDKKLTKVHVDSLTLEEEDV